MIKKLRSVLASFLILLLSFQQVHATTPVLYIDSEEEFLAFSQRCVLDVYSQNLIVKLTKDLDFSGMDYKPVPTFSGVFDGAGHTVKGIVFNESGSNIGMFRYIEETGAVKNLNIEGTINPSGSKSYVGGVVGTNRGHIINVTFSGHVSGLTGIGGIAGLNDDTGVIQFSSNYGHMTGEHYTGGIVGENKGYIGNSKNYGDINTTDDADETNNMASYDIEQVDLNNLGSTENIEAQTDTGGVVGYNVGVVFHCINKGHIGYPHVGYNIGGVIGRHAGYAYGCDNYGTVLGRKDVGGVAGQMEPDVRLLFNEDTLQQLDTELQTLNQLIEETVNKAHTNGLDVSYQVDEVNQVMNRASNHLNTLLTDTSDYADEVSGTVNDGFDRLNKITLQLEYVIDEMKLGSEAISKGFGQLEKGFDEFSKTSLSMNDAFGEIQNAMYDLELASQDADKALFKIQEGMKDISQAAEASQKYKDGVKLVQEGMTDLQDASEDISEALKKIVDYYNANGNLIGFDFGPAIIDLQNASQHLETAIPKLNNGMNLLLSELEDDMALVREAFIWFDSAMTDLRNMSEDLDHMREDMDEAIQDFEDGSASMKKGMDQFSDAMGDFKTATDHMTAGFDYMDKIVNEQQSKPPLQVPMLSEYTEKSGMQLFESLDELSDSIEILNSKIRDSSNILYDNLVLINAQYKIVADIIREGISSLSFDSDAYFEDISESFDTKAIERGLLVNPYNEGNVEGDVDAGGIVGTMAIEFDFDPEDDIVKKGNQSFNFKYQVKAILIGGINKGDVLVKKNNSGGIVGRMDLGMVMNSENYSHIKSSDGHYVGGIAGISSGIIRHCYSMSELEAKKYIGGIAGSGYKIYDSYAMIHVLSGIEYIGSIAGYAEACSNNYFVNNRWAGIDGISYADQSMPLTYETFIKMDVPEPFKNLELTFRIDDQIVEIIDFGYGDSIAADELPNIPVKEGYYGRWSETDLDHLMFSKDIDAIYTTKIQVMASDDAPRPKLLIEGDFEPEDKLRMVPTSTYSLKPGETLIDEWRIAIDESEGDKLVYRYLKPDDVEVKFYQDSDGQWEDIHYEEDGSYLVFESEHHNFKLVVVEEVFDYKIFLIGGVLLLLLSSVFIIKRRVA